MAENSLHLFLLEHKNCRADSCERQGEVLALIYFGIKLYNNYWEIIVTKGGF